MYTLPPLPLFYGVLNGSENLLQIGETVLVGDPLDGLVAELGGQEVYQRTEILHSLDVFRRMADAVKIGAEAHMGVGAHQVEHVGEMPVDALHAGVPPVLLQELAGEGDADEAVRLQQSLYLVIPQVAGMIAEGVGVGMGGDQRFLAVLQHIPETVGGDMGHVHRHADPVHLGHHFAAEFRQTALAALLVDAVGDIVAVAPYQGHAAHAQVVVDPEDLQAAVDGAALLDGQQGVELVVLHVVQVFPGQNLVDIDALLAHLGDLHQVFVNQLQCVTAPAAPAEFRGGNVKPCELQPTAVLDDAARIHHLSVLV